MREADILRLLLHVLLHDASRPQDSTGENCCSQGTLYMEYLRSAVHKDAEPSASRSGGSRNDHRISELLLVTAVDGPKEAWVDGPTGRRRRGTLREHCCVVAKV